MAAGDYTDLSKIAQSLERIEQHLATIAEKIDFVDLDDGDDDDEVQVDETPDAPRTVFADDVDPGDYDEFRS